LILFFFYATVNTMKRYRPLLLQIGVLLLLLSIFFYVLEQRKQFFTVDFSKHYGQNKTVELTGFEEGEGWQGDYSYDSERVMEGKSSITFSSWYGKENTIQNSQVTTIPVGYTNGFISLYIASKQNLQSLVSFSFEIVGEKDQKKEYDLTPLVKLGWNRLAIVLPSWKKITKKSFTILGKSGTIAEVNLDRLWAENTTIYSSDIFSTQNNSLSLRTIGDRTYLFSASPILEQYTLNTPSFIQKGSITFSLIPEHGKQVLLSMNGTSLKIVGKNMDECQLYKNNGLFVTKVLQKTSGKDDIYLFIKAELNNGRIVYSLSNNGIDFETCGAITFSQKKQIQLSLQGSYLIDSLSAEY
jgi:hypothetical protein